MFNINRLGKEGIKMIVFNENDLQKQKTPWGKQVSHALIERDLKQTDMVKYLKDRGFDINKITFHQLLYGVGVNARQGEIDAINKFLDFKISNVKEG